MAIEFDDAGAGVEEGAPAAKKAQSDVKFPSRTLVISDDDGDRMMTVIGSPGRRRR